MSVLNGTMVVLVALSGTAVVLTRDPLRQTVVVGIFGLILAALFFTYQAPDVALSEIVVGSIALPAIILLTLGKLRQREQEAEREQSEASSDAARERRG